MKAIVFVLIFLYMDITLGQNILPEHKRRHCKALQTSDIMEQAMPAIRSAIEVESRKIQRHYESILATLRGGILLTCQEGWIYHNDNCYLFTRTTLTWQKMREHCQARGAYLAEIRSAEENNFVKKEERKIRDTEHPGSYRSYYLGGTDREWERDWKWVRTGETILYNDWAPSEPNNNSWEGEHCLMMFGEKDFLWNDSHCLEIHFGICKKSVGYKTSS